MRRHSWCVVCFIIVSRTGSSGSSSSSSILLKEGQAVSAEVPGLASVLAKLLCTLLPVLQVHYSMYPVLHWFRMYCSIVLVLRCSPQTFCFVYFVCFVYLVSLVFVLSFLCCLFFCRCFFLWILLTICCLC